MSEIGVFDGEIALVDGIKVIREVDVSGGRMETTKRPLIDNMHDRIHVTNKSSMIVMRDVVFTSVTVSTGSAFAEVEFVAGSIRTRPFSHHKT